MPALEGQEKWSGFDELGTGTRYAHHVIMDCLSRAVRFKK
jgi:hypothetical protein